MGVFPIRLVLGVNQKLTPVTSASLRRWADLMVGRHHEFFLCPVTVKPRGIMSYAMTPSGAIVAPDSDDPLPPGNYGWYLDPNLGPSEFPEFTGVNMAMRDKSFEYDVTYMDNEKMWALYKFPPELERLALARDAQRCRVTGNSTDTTLTWIVPPPWGWTVANSNDPADIAPARCDLELHPLGIDPRPFLVAANVIMLRKDLKVHFYNHNFTIDADDNYRVIVLRDMGQSQKLLPTHLPRRSDYDPLDATFFRLHLRHSMNFMLLGGDTREKYPSHVILHEMDLLGVPVPGGDPDREMTPLDDPGWQTELGKAILADVIQVKTELSLYYSDESDSEDSESDALDVFATGGCKWDPPEAWAVLGKPVVDNAKADAWVSEA
ncbi:hypothetical protein B0H13DRAFT_2058035 [Mycena leptocephala]|nr:hypothetical protein B0H13DRAFT_2058035 [Mycena leptocephala]